MDYHKVYEDWLKNVGGSCNEKFSINRKKYLDTLVNSNVITKEERWSVEKEPRDKSETLFAEILPQKMDTGLGTMLSLFRGTAFADLLIRFAEMRGISVGSETEHIGNASTIFSTKVQVPQNGSDTLTACGYYYAQDGKKVIGKDGAPQTDQELSKTKAKQLVMFDEINAPDDVKKVIGEKSFAKIAHDCEKYLSNHEEIVKFAKEQGCQPISIKVTPKYGSYYMEILIPLAVELARTPQARQLVTDILENIVRPAILTPGPLLAYIGALPTGLYLAIGLTAAAGVACLAYGVYAGSNRAIIIGTAFATAASGGLIGASVGSVFPVVGNAVGGALGFTAGLVGGGLLGVVANRFGQ